MSVNWETFKSQLGCWQNASVVYIDDEGSEIPIDSDCEFQEALRLSKINNNRLNLILYVDKSHKIQKNFEVPIKPKNSADMYKSSNLRQNSNDSKLSCPLIQESNLEDNIYNYRETVPPAWFTHYMKKFKKELKSEIIDIVENVIAKSKTLPNSKSDAADGFFFCKSENQFSPITCQLSCSTAVQSKKKRKVSEKDIMDLTKQREVKVPKRLEKLREKSERLEKLCNKTRVDLEEKKRLLEKIVYFKLKLDRMNGIESDKKNVRKSASFREREVFLFLTPGGEFTLNVNIINDGNIAWSAPRLECYEFAGLQIQEPSIRLPKLLPMESCVATLRGKADETVGLLHFKCILVEGVEKIGSEFTCWARVDFDPSEKYCKVLAGSSESNDTTRSEESVDALIVFEKDLIASTEKKIEENIIEIEKRLQDLDLLRPSLAEETPLKNDAEKSKDVNTKKPEELGSVPCNICNIQTFATNHYCNLLQMSEKKEKNWKDKLEQEKIVFGVDCLDLAPERNDACSVKTSEIDDVNEKNKKDVESEISCDSELSVICMSEEDETFFVVPSPSKTPSPAQSVHEVLDKKSLSADSVVKPTVISVEPDMIGINNNRPPKPNANTTNDYSSQLSPARMRRSSLGEISESKPKKMKSESTEYRFTTANLTQPTFTPIPEGFLGKRPCKFTFTGEKKEKIYPEGVFEGRPSRCAFMKEKEKIYPEGVFEGRPSRCAFMKEKENNKSIKVPKTDALGRVIYAVNINGYCLPVRDLFGNGEHCKGDQGEIPKKGKQGNQLRCERRNHLFNEASPVNILPNVLMNGASLALNTAKSVINNLQSAFVAEGKTELGKPACEEKKQVSMEAMFLLYEMGFSDVQLNRKLLLKHDNDLIEVVEELVRIGEISSGQTQ